MGRWRPDSPGRLERAALELFSERGFDETTVAEIAQRAGLTERTFFRHYADKREVLFGGAREFERQIVEAVAAAPATAAPMDAAAAGLRASAAMLQERRGFARQRARVIAANAELHEREVAKMISLAAALARTLRERGVEEPAASLTAEIATAVFRISFERWVQEPRARPLPEIFDESLAEARALAA